MSLREDPGPTPGHDPKYALTYYRSYPKPLYANNPDVPRDLGKALDEIDKDVEEIARNLGTGTNWKGEVPTQDDLPDDPADGDLWLVTDTNHLWVYTESGWVDLGVAGKEGPEGPQGPIGPTGQKGDKGDTGAEGAKGDKGDKGDKGNTGETGPRGPTGPDGAKGKGWTSGYYTSSSGRVTFTSDDGLGFATTDLRGTDGAKGDQGEVAVDSTETGEPGTPAVVEDLLPDDSTKALLKFTIPKGEKGEDGNPGICYPDYDALTNCEPVGEGNMIPRDLISGDAGNSMVLGSDEKLYTPPVVPVGTIMLWATNAEPADGKWIFCRGQKTDDYPALKAVVGDNVPDLQGRVAVGKNTSGTFATLGGKTGAESENKTLTTTHLPVHNHNFSYGSTPASWPYTGNPDVGGGVAFSVGRTVYGAIGIANSGSQQSFAVNRVQPSLILNYIIKAVE